MSPMGSFTGGRLGRRRRTAPALAPAELRTAWQAVSLLLDYPTAELIAVLPAIDAAVAELPANVGDPLRRLAGHLAGTELRTLEADYVATFDYTRRCALHLSYYAFGDTRKRGVALVRFKQAYRAAGLEVTEAELPDHVCVVCAFGAGGEVDAAWKLLTEHRAGLELLRLALIDRGSPWLDAVVALTATLPPLDGEGTEAVARLLAQGPPGEEVGLDAYSLDPALNPHPDADALLEGARA